MKILLKILGFGIAYVLPLLIFINTEWGLNVVEHNRWVIFLFIIPTAFLFTVLVNGGIKDAGKKLNYRTWDVTSGEYKTIRNPFWWWFIVTVIIQAIMTFLYE